jgi:hypothetical protein
MKEAIIVLAIVAVISGVAIAIGRVARSEEKAKYAPATPPVLSYFNAGPCNYLMVSASNGISIVHRGDCTNHNQ